ncbi:MAG: hypothetical protein NTW91_04045 [Verrucomicrobia bacterium]|nr:hypothetical protein [Verrucomicrobiota bacterium]
MARKDQRFSLLTLLLLLPFVPLTSPCSLKASDESCPSLLLGGYFERPPVSRFLPGSRKTLIFPADIDHDNRVLPLASSGRLFSTSWDSFLKKAQERSSLLLATLNPAMIRDSRGVIQMAVITNDSPLTASCILLPGFLKRFSAIFGPELIVAVPARNKIYVFPKLANQLPSMTETIRDDYLISPQPVSTELFELSNKGIRAIGNVDASE